MAEGSSCRSDCSICLEKFTAPRLLPCFHTFCTICLEKYMEKNSRQGKFSCPLCRKSADVPSNGAEGFQTNFYIETDAADAKQVPAHCDVCGPETKAVDRCLDCEENFCPSCTKAHTAMKMSRHHNIVNIGSAGSSTRSGSNSKTFCPVHPGDEIRVLCKECDKVLCLVCMVTEHSGHKSVEIAKEAGNIRAELKDALDEKSARHHQKLLSDEVTYLRKEKGRLADDLSSEQAQLKKHAEEIKDVVDLLVKGREKELAREYKLCMDKNEQELNALDARYNAWASLRATSDRTVRGGTNVEVVKEGRRLIDEINKLKDDHGKIHITEHPKQNLFKKGVVDKTQMAAMVGSILAMQHLPETKPTTLSKAVRLTNVTPLTGRISKRGWFTILGLFNSGIFGITPAGNGNFWVSGNENKVVRCDASGKVSLTCQVEGFCVTSDKAGNCIVTCPSQKSIKRISIDGTVDTIISNVPAKPYGVGYRCKPSGEEEIVFSCLSTVYTAQYKTGGMNKEKISVLASGFTEAYYIALDEASGNVSVVSSSDLNSSVTIIDERGNVIASYQDKNGIPEMFGAWYDDQGCLLVISSHSHQIRRLRPNGTLMEILPEKTTVRGYTLCIDVDGSLLIGGAFGNVDVYRISK